MFSEKTPKSQGVRLLQQLFLRGHRIFTFDDVIEAAKIENIPLKQLRKIISNLVKQELVLRLRRGLFVSVGLLPDHIDIPPFVISSYLVQPSAISHWSALQHHGLTEQVSPVITASTPKKVVTPSMREKKLSPHKNKHTWEIAGIKYEYITVQERHFFGTEKIWLGEYFQVLITDKERTLLDLFIYSKMFGGMGEALGILENSLSSIDIKKLVDYAIKFGMKSIAKRLGWALEYFGVSRKYLIPLLKVPINYYCRLDSTKPAAGVCDKRWMIQNNLK